MIGLADDQRVAPLGDELERVQLEACLARQLGVETPVEIGQRGALVQPGLVVAPLGQSGTAPVEFVLQDQREGLQEWLLGSLGLQDAMQKECLRFFGLAVPRGVTFENAEKLIEGHRAALDDTDSKRADEWDAFELVVGNLSDRENRADYGIKKPTLAAIRQAFDALLADGTAAEDIDDQLVVEKLLELKPELATD